MLKFFEKNTPEERTNYRKNFCKSDELIVNKTTESCGNFISALSILFGIGGLLVAPLISDALAMVFRAIGLAKCKMKG